MKVVNVFIAGICACGAAHSALQGYPWLVLIQSIVAGLNLYVGTRP